jgi:hypothetical protein
MKITIESTSKMVTLRDPGGGSVVARVWEGHTDTGIPVFCFIPRIAPTIPEPLPIDVAQQFATELQEMRAPTPLVDSIPLRMII